MPGYSVDFALLLYDEFSGAAINDAGVQFLCGGVPVVPLHKPDGHYVFGGFGDDATPTLTIKRPHYLDRVVQIDKKALPSHYPVQTVRLYRKHSGVWRDCVWLTGAAVPNSLVLAVGVKTAFKLHSAKKNEAGDSITIFGGGNAALVGRRYGADKSTDTFVITKMLSLNDFLTDALPEFVSGEKPFARAYLSQSGENGQYHIPVDQCPEGYPDKAACYNAEKGKWVWEKTALGENGA